MTKTIDINESIIKKYVDSLKRDDLELRKQLDFEYLYDGKAAILYEVRPVCNDPERIQHVEFAKIRLIKSRQEWNLYWMRANGKWEFYRPFPKSTNLNKIIKVIEEDNRVVSLDDPQYFNKYKIKKSQRKTEAKANRGIVLRKLLRHSFAHGIRTIPQPSE